MLNLHYQKNLELEISLAEDLKQRICKWEDIGCNQDVQLRGVSSLQTVCFTKGVVLHIIGPGMKRHWKFIRQGFCSVPFQVKTECQVRMYRASRINTLSCGSRHSVQKHLMLMNPLSATESPPR